MRSLVTPMLLISLGLHGGLLLIPTSQEEKSPENNPEIVQAAETEAKFFPTPEVKSATPQPTEAKKTPPSPPPAVALASAQTRVNPQTQRQPRRQTVATRQPQTAKTKAAKPNNSSNGSSRNSRTRTSSRSASPNTTRETNSRSVSTTRRNSANSSSTRKKNVPSNQNTSNRTTRETQRRVDNIPTFASTNTNTNTNTSTNTNYSANTPVISSLAPANSNTNSAPVATVPAIIARTQNQDERVTNRLEFLKTFPRYPEAQWGLPDGLQSAKEKQFFYRLQTRDGIEIVAKKFMEELLPQSQFTGELNTNEDNWQVYQVSNGKNTQYLHLISQGGNTGIFLASEQLSKEDLIK